MTLPFPKDWNAYLSISMVFFRLLGLFLLVPGFSHRSIPVPIKILLALVISLALYPVLKSRLVPVPTELGGVVLYAVRETIIGFLMGFVAYMTFEAVHLAAQFAGYQMGFGAIGLMDPVNQANVSVLVPMAGWVALMVYLFMDLHHELLQLFVYSFEVPFLRGMPPWGDGKTLMLLVRTAGELFVVAVKIAAPFTLLVLAANVAVGVLSRLLPQMHMILFVFPVTLFLGMFALYVLAPDLISYFESFLGDMGHRVALLFRTI